MKSCYNSNAIFCRSVHYVLFAKPVPIKANTWYLAWAHVSGASSDCGACGQPVVTTADQLVDINTLYLKMLCS